MNSALKAQALEPTSANGAAAAAHLPDRLALGIAGLDDILGGVPGSGTVQPDALGIAGLDDILGGGLTRNHLYLIEGDPGTGKTTIAMQFLMEGVRRGQKGLYVTLSESKEELREIADSHGWTLDGVELFELTPDEAQLDPEAQYTVFNLSEVEMADATKAVLAEVDRLKPARVVFDSLSELRLLARDSLRYRRQILALKQYFSGRKCTVLLLDDRTGENHDQQLQSIAHGVIMLESAEREYGIKRRRLEVKKLRGSKFREGFHDYCILRGGVEVYPRLVASEHVQSVKPSQLPSGIAELDTLLGGGIDSGTSTLLLGPAGCGNPPSPFAAPLPRWNTADTPRSLPSTKPWPRSSSVAKGSAWTSQSISTPAIW